MERLAYTWNSKYANNGGSNAHKTPEREAPLPKNAPP